MTPASAITFPGLSLLVAAWMSFYEQYHINNDLGLNVGDKQSLLAKDQELYFLMVNEATGFD